MIRTLAKKAEDATVAVLGTAFTAALMPAIVGHRLAEVLQGEAHYKDNPGIIEVAALGAIVAPFLVVVEVYHRAEEVVNLGRAVYDLLKEPCADD